MSVREARRVPVEFAACMCLQPIGLADDGALSSTHGDVCSGYVVKVDRQAWSS